MMSRQRQVAILARWLVFAWVVRTARFADAVVAAGAMAVADVRQPRCVVAATLPAAGLGGKSAAAD